MTVLIKKSAVHARNTLQKSIEDLFTEALLKIPDGFNNNILWQIGHILVAGNLFFINNNSDINIEDKRKYFAPGTKPADWDEFVPSI